MLNIALTGNLGSGKSTVGKMFQKLGARVFDADQIIRGFYQEKGEVYQKIVQAFGNAVLNERGEVDRKKLADQVFEDSQKLNLLESITHAALYKKLEEELKSLPHKSLVLVEASLLIEKGTYRKYDVTLVVYAPYEVCRERAIRSGFDPQDFERRWKRQMPPEDKLRYASFVIDNQGSLQMLSQRVGELYRVFSNWQEFGNERRL